MKTRFLYPEDERKYTWLPMLLDAYGIIDQASLLGLNMERRIRHKEVACKKGCSECCMRPSIPFTQIELTGISWYACEKLENGIRDKVMNQLQNHLKTAQCPFLVDNCCTIYPVRPIACRQFFVFGDTCAYGEDVSRTRQNDTWSPSRDVAKKVAMKILPFWGIASQKQKILAFESGFISSNSAEMHLTDWVHFHKRMILFDATQH
jgi:uncharacterized protein